MVIVDANLNPSFNDAGSINSFTKGLVENDGPWKKRRKYKENENLKKS